MELGCVVSPGRRDDHPLCGNMRCLGNRGEYYQLRTLILTNTPIVDTRLAVLICLLIHIDAAQLIVK